MDDGRWEMDGGSGVSGGEGASEYRWWRRRWRGEDCRRTRSAGGVVSSDLRIWTLSTLGKELPSSKLRTIMRSCGPHSARPSFRVRIGTFCVGADVMWNGFGNVEWHQCGQPQDQVGRGPLPLPIRACTGPHWSLTQRRARRTTMVDEYAMDSNSVLSLSTMLDLTSGTDLKSRKMR